MNHRLFFLLLFSLPVSLHGQHPPELFVYSGQEYLQQSTDHPVGGNLVRVDLDALANSLSVPPTAILPDNRRYDMQTEDIDWREEGAFKWVGQFSGLNGKTLDSVITVKNKMASGVILGPEVEYQLIPLGPGLHRLEKVNQAPLPECGGAISPHGTRAPAGVEQGFIPPPTDDDTPAVMDVLVVYTPEAKAAAGGTDQIQLRIQNSIDFSNQAYLNSTVEHRVRLVAASEVDILEEGQTAPDLLHAAKLDSSTNALRDSYGADIVALVVADLGEGIGGYASLMTKYYCP